MRMMKNWIVGVMLLGTVISYGQIYQGSTQLGTSMSLDITLNTNTDSVSMEFSGPSSGYYAVGFGGTGMTNTYTVVVNSNGTVQERKLGNHQGGNVLSASVAYNAVVAGGVRTAYIERARAGASGNHYTFSSNGGAINLIWAKGGTSFGNHGGSNRGFASINLVDQCNIPNTVLAAQNICQGDSVQVFGEWIKQSGIYYDSLSTPLGCDSIVEQQVLVNNTINNTIASTGLCAGDSIFYLDAWRTDTGTVVYNGVTAAGCDSIVTGRVEYLPTVDTGSIWVAPYIDASFYVGLDTGATYYWFNCNTGVFVDTTMGADTLNPGNEFLQAPDTGFYAAIIVKPGYCSDTSACYYFYMGVPEYNYGISLRPNPTQKDLEIKVDNFTSPIGYQLLSVSGRVLETGLLRSNSTLLDVRHYAAGMYLLRLDDGRTMKWIKE
ncbi:MAG: T9SS type A sorting domain-containing protein [Schleiferiaceae bacterium]